MALLDVSEVLADPDFADPLVCERITQIVGSDGIAVNTPREIPFVGVVTTDTGAVLDRAAAGERVLETITVHTPFRLIAGEPGITADVARWDGRRYTVARVAKNSHFGRGFVAASCDLLPLSG
jgi:hypothetical protein